MNGPPNDRDRITSLVFALAFLLSRFVLCYLSFGRKALFEYLSRIEDELNVFA